jgi:methionyl-tRNA formyltransferase
MGGSMVKLNTDSLQKKLKSKTITYSEAIINGNEAKVTITENETAGSLHDKLMKEGAALIVENLKQLEKGSLQEKPQVVSKDVKHAPKLFTETCLIDFNQPVSTVYNLIRGLSPYPAAFTLVQQKKMKLFTCSKLKQTHDLVPGSIQTDNKTYLRFACTDGLIDVKELQLEGKTRMKTEDFLRGNKIF